jgi:hypothetical protein
MLKVRKKSIDYVFDHIDGHVVVSTTLCNGMLRGEFESL